MVNPPGVGVPNSSPDHLVNNLEFFGYQPTAGIPAVSAATDGLVYLGEEFSLRNIQTGEPPGRTYTVSPTDPRMYVTKDAAYTAFWRLQPEQRREWDALVTAFDGEAPDEARSNAVWRTVAGYAAETYKADPNNPMSIMDIMRQQAINAQDDPRRGGGGGAYMGPVTTISKSVDYNLTNPTEARAFLNDALGQYLGRRPTDDEYQNFQKALNIQERGAPTITEAETTVTPQGQARRTQESESTRKGGFLPQQFAEEYALSQEGAGEQGASLLLNDLLNVMRGGRQ